MFYLKIINHTQDTNNHDDNIPSYKKLTKHMKITIARNEGLNYKQL